MPEETVVAPETVEQSTVAAETTQVVTPTQEGTPFKSFATEEEYNNFVKSTVSKSKNEILKALETSSVDEGKQKISEAEKLGADLQLAFQKLSQLEEENAVVKLGVSDEFREEALTLAKAKVSGDVSLEQSLSEVIKKFPNLLKNKPGVKVEKIGTEKSESKTSTDDDVRTMLKNRYPWLKNI